MLKERRFLILGLLLMVLGAVLGSLVEFRWNPRHLQPLPVQASSSTAERALDSQLPVASFAGVVKKALPAVVKIDSTRVVKMEGNPMIPDDSWLRQFFGGSLPGPFQMPPERKERGLGSGVIVDPNGYILTNDHVVDGADNVRVTLSDEQEFDAKLVGADPKSDLALLKIEAQDLPYLLFEDSSRLEVGDIVLAIGNPFGVGQTVTMGIVSATGRGNLGIEDYEDFIQTDAAINPGNSGGALIDTNGNLLGINTAIIGQSGGNDGVGLAVPSRMATYVYQQLRENGKVSRGLLGAVIQDVTPDIATAFNLDQTRGALVSDLTPDGPGMKAGLQRGDVIISLNGREVPDSRRLRLWIAETAPGTQVNLTLLRGGRQVVLPVVLDELSEGVGSGHSEKSEREGSSKGLSVQELTPELRRSLRLSDNINGVVVSDVEPGSSAEEAGLQRGDVIQEVNRRGVANMQQFLGAMNSGSGSSILLLVNRGGNTVYLVLK